MNPSSTQIGPSDVHPDAYRVVRVATEFALRGFDLLTEVQGDAIDGLIVMTLVHDQMSATRRKAGSALALSRRLDMPKETIRRRVEKLILSSQCVAGGGALACRRPC